MTENKIIVARFRLARREFMLDVDLTLPGRGVTALFGHSGSGKTTLLRCLAGLEKDPLGFLSVNGDCWQDAQRCLPTHKRPLGYVFQEANLFPHLTVLGNLRYGIQRIPAAKATDLTPVIDLLGIGHLLKRKPESLSGGERQRVGIARALALSPELLLMDEPLSALDVQRKNEILPYLERLHDELEIPVIYVTHSPDEVARLADYLVVLEQGTVLAEGGLFNVLTRLDLPISLGEDVGVVLSATIGAIDEVWQLARLDFSGGSLWTRHHGFAVGKTLRVRVLARDVSLAVEHPGLSSIQNILFGVVDAIGDDHHEGLALVRVRVGESIFIARLTKRAAFELKISLGQALWLQVKSVALLE